MKALDIVSLNIDYPEFNLKKGDAGTIVHCYNDGEAVEVEFVNADGKTLAVLTIEHKDIELFQGNQILSIRHLQTQE